MERTRVLIMGAAGRDFHNFQVCYRDDPSVEVVAFTAAQIPGIEDRHYPRELAGTNYPDGIPIFPEDRLFEIVRERGVHVVVFAYSDMPHLEVMHRASMVQAAGADFTLLGPDSTMLRASVPVISVCAVRTGCGKSGVTERIWEILRDSGIRAVIIRHPMPYDDLARSRVERFASREDLARHHCTVEEREEYEHYINKGIVVYAGVDYQAILEAAQRESEVILWDGGNNDFAFIKPDLEIVVMDPHRAGHERLYHPGEVNLLRADVLVINKIDSARPEDISRLLMSAQERNPKAAIVQTASKIHVQHEERIRGSRVLVIEDGPTLTHGEMDFGAGVLAARAHGAAEIVDPRPYAVGSLKECFDQYSHLKDVLPAAGYYPEQLRDLELTIERTPCDLVLVATPIDLSRLINIDKQVLRVSYGIEDHGSPTLNDVLDRFIREGVKAGHDR